MDHWLNIDEEQNSNRRVCGNVVLKQLVLGISVYCHKKKLKIINLYKEKRSWRNDVKNSVEFGKGFIYIYGNAKRRVY